MARRVLFLCTHNSARSQMAEGLLRALGGEEFDVSSAGTVATKLRPEAAAVMAEWGVDVSGQTSETLDRYLHQDIDLVITVCDGARDSCPVFASAKESRHWSIEDPAAVEGGEEERLAAFREARDELRRRIESDLLEEDEGMDDGGNRAENSEHYRKLERMYHAAPTNRYYRPRMTVSKGEAEVVVEVRPEFFHSAGAVHGSVYFKVLDDACFFAANSLVHDHFVLTTSFNLYLTRPINGGSITATGKVVHRSKRILIAEAEAVDSLGRKIARGGGTFLSSRLPLGPEVGYV